MEKELFIGSVYLGGLLSFFSPCIFPLLPVYIGMLSNSGQRSILKTLTFVIGLSVSFVLLGFGAGIIGQILTSNLFRIISGFMVIIFGLFQMELIEISFFQRTKLLELKESNSKGILGTFLLGFTFSLGWTPCVGPILASILFVSSGGGSGLYGALLMFIYVLGLATPFVIFSLFWKHLKNKIYLNKLKNNLNFIKKLGGFLIVIMGLLLITNKLNIFI